MELKVSVLLTCNNLGVDKYVLSYVLFPLRNEIKLYLVTFITSYGPLLEKYNTPYFPKQNKINVH